MSAEKVCAQRRAVLYVRQSSAHQVQYNRESQVLQYAMRERLAWLGWSEVEVIDDDLGCSAAGGVARAGFERVVAEVCLGKVGAVAAREVSRFARNSHDWQQLVEMCRVVDTLLIDQEAVYAPRDANDRLLLGLKGSLNEYELDLLRQRSSRYVCTRGRLDYGEASCIGFGGLRVDDVVETALLAVVRPAAVEAALAAEAQAMARRDEARETLARDLKAARYAADRAFRQYNASDPENRLVTGELEARWNRALVRLAEVEQCIASHDAALPRQAPVPLSFAALAEDLRVVWSAPTTDARLKKRIVRTVIREAVADLDDATAEVVVLLHWMGGAHTEHRLPRRRRGQRNSTSPDIVEAVRDVALIMKDDVIAGVLNRSGLRTGNNNQWTRERVTSLRSHYGIPVHIRATDNIELWLNLNRAAATVGVAARTLRLAAERGEIDAKHPLEGGPWLFRRADLEGPAAQSLAQRAQGNSGHPTVSVPA